jgi:hypothetical protein
MEMQVKSRFDHYNIENEKMRIYFIEDPDGYWIEIVRT